MKIPKGSRIRFFCAFNYFTRTPDSARLAFEEEVKAHGYSADEDGWYGVYMDFDKRKWRHRWMCSKKGTAVCSGNDDGTFVTEDVRLDRVGISVREELRERSGTVFYDYTDLSLREIESLPWTKKRDSAGADSYQLPLQTTLTLGLRVQKKVAVPQAVKGYTIVTDWLPITRLKLYPLK